MSVSCELSGRGACVRLITHPEDSYWVWCILTECGHEALAVWTLWSTRGCHATWGGGDAGGKRIKISCVNMI